MGGKRECMGLSNGSAGGKAEIHGVSTHIEFAIRRLELA